MRKLFLLFAVFFLAASLNAQYKIFAIGDISTREGLQQAEEVYSDYLDDAESADDILQGLFEVAHLKCYFPFEKFEDLIDSVKKHKIRGITPDIKFAAASTAKLFSYNLSVWQSQALLQITDKKKFFDQIGAIVY